MRHWISSWIFINNLKDWNYSFYDCFFYIYRIFISRNFFRFLLQWEKQYRSNIKCDTPYLEPCILFWISKSFKILIIIHRNIISDVTSYIWFISRYTIHIQILSYSSPLIKLKIRVYQKLLKVKGMMIWIT